MLNIPCSVRAAGVSDFEAWHPLWLDYLEFYKKRLSLTVDLATWGRLTEPGSEHACLLGVSPDGTVQGFAIYLLHRSSWAETWNCLIEDLYVRPHARGMGFGRLLLDAVFEKADQRQCFRTYWQTDRDNESARRLYDSVADVADVVQYRRRVNRIL